jgi:hypothetical protein
MPLGGRRKGLLPKPRRPLYASKNATARDKALVDAGYKTIVTDHNQGSSLCAEIYAGPDDLFVEVWNAYRCLTEFFLLEGHAAFRHLVH